MRRVSVVAGGLAIAAIATAGGHGAAMELAVEREAGLLAGKEIVRIKAVGEIVVGDSDRFRELVGQLTADPDVRPSVVFDSPGGNVLEGLLIGTEIRDRGLTTEVPPEGVCASACAFAFIGGVERYVSGAFAIHAMSMTASDGAGPQSPDPSETLDAVQQLSALLVIYARDMTGKSEMAEVALQIGSKDLAVVSDELLRDWRIITHAGRPTQRVAVQSGLLSRCAETSWLGENVAPRYVLCSNLTVARQYLEIQEALDKLQDRPLAGDLEAEQRRWVEHWDGCAAPGDLPTWQWHGLIEDCVKAAFDARWRELDALVEYYEVGESEPARSNWKRPR